MNLSKKSKELGNRIRGEVILAGDPGYDGARTIWNDMIERRPAVVARCLGPADVAESIRFARDNDLEICIKGGGHNISGLSLVDDGMLIDMSMNRGVWVDDDRKIARAQAGCLLGDVDAETQRYGLAAVLGFVSETGVAGLTLGGGFGYLTRQYGWTTDNVLGMELVTANGDTVKANDRENPELFWALRGGGGNFGVVTGFEYALHPVGPAIYSGGIAWRAEMAPEILNALRVLSVDMPPEYVCVAALRIAPPAPWLAEEVHGKPIVALFICHTGSIQQAKEDISPIKEMGDPVGDAIQERSYVSQQCMLDKTQPKGRRNYWKSEYLPSLDDGLLEKVMFHAGHITSPHSAILLFPVYGALNDLPEDHSAVGNRNARWIINFAGSWEEPDEDDRHIGWAREAWRDIQPYSTGGTYVNFLTEEEGDGRIKAAYGDNYERLAEVKQKWDPENVFRINKNIAPKQPSEF